MIDGDGIYRIYEPIDSCEYEPDKKVEVFNPTSVFVPSPFR